MKRRVVVLAALVVLAQAGMTRAAILGVIDFESHPAGAIYGSPAIPAGSVVFIESGVPFRVSDFTLPSGGSSYNFARVDSSATGQSLELIMSCSQSTSPYFKA
jgi:hypothetical protein